MFHISSNLSTSDSAKLISFLENSMSPSRYNLVVSIKEHSLMVRLITSTKEPSVKVSEEVIVDKLYLLIGISLIEGLELRLKK